MINKLFHYMVIFITLFIITSCQKESFHKIKFEVEFIQDCQDCIADYFHINCTPKYADEDPKLCVSQISDGYVWDYEYWALRDGDRVNFSVLPTAEGYQYRMNIYIDGVLVSYRECYGESGSEVIDEWGLNNNQRPSGTIIFTYYE